MAGRGGQHTHHGGRQRRDDWQSARLPLLLALRHSFFDPISFPSLSPPCSVTDRLLKGRHRTATMTDSAMATDQYHWDQWPGRTDGRMRMRMRAGLAHVSIGEVVLSVCGGSGVAFAVFCLRASSGCVTVDAMGKGHPSCTRLRQRNRHFTPQTHAAPPTHKI